MQLDICYVINKNDEEYVNMDGLIFVWQKQITLNMRNRSGWLDRGTTPWGFLNQLISHLPFNIILIGYQHSTICHCGIPRFNFCHCESTLSLYGTYYHCNTHLTFSNTSFYSKINKLQLSIKTITRTATQTHHHISHIRYIHTYTH